MSKVNVIVLALVSLMLAKYAGIRARREAPGECEGKRSGFR